ncbi:unnamed protein product, partial [Brassica oleracea]
VLVFSVLFNVLKKKRQYVSFGERSGRKTRLKNDSLNQKTLDWPLISMVIHMYILKFKQEYLLGIVLSYRKA